MIPSTGQNIDNMSCYTCKSIKLSADYSEVNKMGNPLNKTIFGRGIHSLFSTFLNGGPVFSGRNRLNYFITEVLGQL